MPSFLPKGDLEDTTPPPASAPGQTCPRCGGASAPRRVTRRSNPFLSSQTLSKVPLTCVDCGLDFEVDP